MLLPSCGRILCSAVASGLALFCSCILQIEASAQSYPDHPIKLVVGFSAGGGIDTVARIVGQATSKALPQQIVIENRTGAGGSVAAEYVAKSLADGYTLFITAPGSAVINPYLLKDIKYRFEDFSPIVLIGYVPLVVVVQPSSKINSISNLISAAKANPDKLKYGTPGIGTSNHLATVQFESLTGTRMSHIPYKGPQANTDLIAGDLDLIFDAITTSAGFINNGQLKALAVTTSSRSPLLPSVPTIAESGVPQYSASNWYGVVAPAKTPEAIVRKLNADMVAAIRNRDTERRLLALGVIIAANSPAEFRSFLAAEYKKMGELVQASGIKPE